MPALAELEAAWVEARADAGFRAELAGCCATTSAARRRSTGARGCPRRWGAQIYLKREDLLHTGAHKINNALGQALLAKRMGKTRIIAETGAGQHGVATATACALLGLECVVYMGTEDMRRQQPNVQRMRLLGATVGRSTPGRGRSRRRSTRRSATGSPTSRHALHHRLERRPAPFPALVRDLQRVIGDEARARCSSRPGACPSAWSPASAAAPTRSASSCRSSTTPRSS